jgi:hypothetical protein
LPPKAIAGFAVAYPAQRVSTLLEWRTGVSSYPADTEVPWFRSRVVCAKCGGRGNKIDARPNWKEQPPQQSLVGKVFR